jgi:thioredoxin reductase (NADPH)
MELKEYKCEVLIIGAGPAGLSAGVYCGRANRSTIILDGKEPSALERTKEIQNWLGEAAIGGLELLKKFKKHAESFDNVDIIKGDVIALMLGMGMNMVSTRNANITADVVLIATGTGVRKEVIKGESGLTGFGVSYCALCDGPLFKERTVYLYGSDEEVLEDALALDQMGCITHVITNVGFNDLPELASEVKEKGIEIIDNMEIVEAISDSDGLIQKILCKTTKTEQEDQEIQEYELACLFILSHIPSNSIFKKAGVELDENGNVAADENQQTNIQGVYAAGDVTGGLFQVVFAAAEGARAGINACKYLRKTKKE